MCGEKGLSTFWSRNHSGSPPRMRGKGICFRLEKRPRGITPACAGKSKCRLVSCGHIWDHPRMCGEKLFAFLVFCPNIGSPPHVRGKDANKVLWMEKFRITPACAGKSHRRSNLHVQQGDHPRMCGDKSLLPSSPSQRMGSPPHVRGKAVKLAQYFDVTGITPACAGKSPSFRMISNKNGDHPRMCGEKTKKIP